MALSFFCCKIKGGDSMVTICSWERYLEGLYPGWVQDMDLLQQLLESMPAELSMLRRGYRWQQIVVAAQLRREV